MIVPRRRLLLLGLLLMAASPPPLWARVDLTALSLESLMEIPITGVSKYEQKQDTVAAAASVITRREIKAFGWRTLAEALASLPGVHTTYDRQYTYLGTRGFGLPGDFNTRVLLAVNGNRWNDVVYDLATLGRALPLDLALIERIEFIPGPGGAVYGQNALFGVINVVTRRGAAVNATELALAYQGPQAARQGRATWGGTLDNGVELLLSASALRARGEDRVFDYPGAAADFPALADERGLARGMDGERDEEFYAQLGRGPWSVDFAHGDRRKDDPTASYFAQPLVGGQYQRDRYLHAQLQYQDRFAADTLQLSGRLFLGRSRYSGRFNYETPFRSTGSGDWQGGELRLVSTAWAGHTLMLGTEYQDNSRHDQTNEDLLDPANDIVIRGASRRAGVYAQDEWLLAPALTAILGLRLDHSSVAGHAWSPRAGLVWRATPATTLKTLYGRAHRVPNAYERDFEDDGQSQVANPDLDRETVDTLELVVDHRVGPDLRLRGSIYRWDMSGLVTLGTDAASGLSQYQSGEDVRARGVELSADKTWAGGGRLRGSLSHQDAAYASGARPINSPRWLGKLNVSAPLAATAVRMGYELQYSSARRSLDGTALTGYWLSNLHFIADAWADGLEVSLGLYNLFDRRFSHPAAAINWQNALEQDGRSVRLMLGYRF